MSVTVRIPDAFAARFGSPEEMERRALEALALDEFRLGRLTRLELKGGLGLATRAKLDGFLVAHGLSGHFGPDGLESDRADLSRLGL